MDLPVPQVRAAEKQKTMERAGPRSIGRQPLAGFRGKIHTWLWAKQAIPPEGVTKLGATLWD